MHDNSGSQPKAPCHSARVRKALLASGLTSTERLVCMVLLEYADYDTGHNARPSQATLADGCGLSRRSVANTLSALVSKGVLVAGEKQHAREVVSYSILLENIPSKHRVGSERAAYERAAYERRAQALVNDVHTTRSITSREVDAGVREDVAPESVDAPDTFVGVLVDDEPKQDAHSFAQSIVQRHPRGASATLMQIEQLVMFIARRVTSGWSRSMVFDYVSDKAGSLLARNRPPAHVGAFVSYIANDSDFNAWTQRNRHTKVEEVPGYIDAPEWREETPEERARGLQMFREAMGLTEDEG